MAALKGDLFLELFVGTLLVGFCFATAPVSLAREFTPTELIAKRLPGKKTIKTASKAEFLSAICAAVRRNPEASAGIASAAVSARAESAGEIVATVLRCRRKLDCEDVRAIVSAAVGAQSSAVTAISDAAIARAPNCQETIESALQARSRKAGDHLEPAVSPGESAPNSGPIGVSEGFDPHETLQPICANGIQRAVRASLVEEFLRANPGSFLGQCSPTPSPSPLPMASPAVRK